VSKFRIAVLISGSGTTLKNLIRKRDAGLLDVEFSLVVSSNPDARGLEFARNANIPEYVYDHRVYSTTDEISHEVFAACREHHVDLVVCGGFLRRLKIEPDFVNRVINIHPGLIPEFCGKGMYGKHVHQAVISAGRTESGCSVHLVDDQFDHGPIVAQKKVAVHPDDTPETLAARVFEAECELYPAVIQGIANGKIRIDSDSIQVSSGIFDKS